MNWSTRFDFGDVWKLLVGVVLGFGATILGEAVLPTVGPVTGSTMAVTGAILLSVALCDCCLGLRRRDCGGRESGCC